jgi:hypothetical protein
MEKDLKENLKCTGNDQFGYRRENEREMQLRC